MKQGTLLLFLLLFILCAIQPACTKDQADIVIKYPYCDTLSAKFQKDIVPIMNLHCSNPPFANCHSWATDHSALKLYINNGSFQDRVLDLKNMPPINNIDNAPPLSELDIMKLNCWISQGAPNN